MKKLLLAGFVVFTFILYVFHQQNNGASAVIAPPSLSTGTNSPPTKTGNSSAGASPGSGTGSPSAASYKDGQYTGSSADAYYGYVQVKAVIQGGKITDVQFLQYPSDHSTSVAINQQAMPYLQQEAIQAQSAQVDIISGATYTSQAFIQSLTGALSQAHS